MYGQPVGFVQQQPVGFVQQQPVVIMGGNQQQQAPGSYCPVCNTNTGSKVDYQVTGKTWMWCIVLFIFTGVCCWIPFVCDDCKERQVQCVTCESRKA